MGALADGIKEFEAQKKEKREKVMIFYTFFFFWTYGKYCITA